MSSSDSSVSDLYILSEFIPYVDRLSDGKTPFNRAIKRLYGGSDAKRYLSALPEFEPVGGTTFFPAEFEIVDLILNSDDKGDFPIWFILMVEELVHSFDSTYLYSRLVFDIKFDDSTSGRPKLPADTVRQLVNSPTIWSEDLCLKTEVHFEEPAIIEQTPYDSAGVHGSFISVMFLEDGSIAYQGAEPIVGYIFSGSQITLPTHECKEAARNAYQATQRGARP